MPPKRPKAQPVGGRTFDEIDLLGSMINHKNSPKPDKLQDGWHLVAYAVDRHLVVVTVAFAEDRP